MKIKIPASIEDAINNLNGIDALMTAKGWEKAALVAAFCEKAKPGPAGDTPDNRRISMTEFADLGINGLNHRNTVSMYLQAWAETGLPTPTPGKQCDLPSDPWPPASLLTGRDYDDEKAGGIANDPAKVEKVLSEAAERLGASVVAAAIKSASAETAAAVEQQLTKERATRDRGNSDQINSDFADVSGRARAVYDRHSTGYGESAAADVARLTRNLMEVRLMNVGGSTELINALKAHQAFVDAYVSELTGDHLIEWTENDRVLAAELGIKLEVSR
jgi:hypothetical protein